MPLPIELSDGIARYTSLRSRGGLQPRKTVQSLLGLHNQDEENPWIILQCFFENPIGTSDAYRELKVSLVRFIFRATYMNESTRVEIFNHLEQLYKSRCLYERRLIWMHQSHIKEPLKFVTALIRLHKMGLSETSAVDLIGFDFLKEPDVFVQQLQSIRDVEGSVEDSCYLIKENMNKFIFELRLKLYEDDGISYLDKLMKGLALLIENNFLTKNTLALLIRDNKMPNYQYKDSVDAMVNLKEVDLWTAHNRALFAPPRTWGEAIDSINTLKKHDLLTQKHLELVRWNKPGLITGLLELNKHHMLNEDNIDLIQAHEHPKEMAKALTTLRAEAELSMQYMDWLQAESHPDQLAEKIVILKKYNLLKESYHGLLKSHITTNVLSRILLALKSNNILIKKNIIEIMYIDDPKKMELTSKGLESLSMKGILNQRNFDFMIVDDHTFNMSAILIIMFEARLLSAENYAQIQSHANEVSLFAAIRSAKFLGILDQRRFRLLVSSSEPLSITQGFRALKEADFLAEDQQKFFTHDNPSAMGKAIFKLHTAKILNKENLDILWGNSVIVSEQAKTVFWDRINPKFLTQEVFVKLSRVRATRPENIALAFERILYPLDGRRLSGISDTHEQSVEYSVEQSLYKLSRRYADNLPNHLR